jgi:hypothetical protein
MLNPNALLAKIQALPHERIADIEEFVDFQCREQERAIGAIGASATAALLTKIQALPPERIADIEEFVDFQCREEERAIRAISTSATATMSAIATVWNDPESDVSEVGEFAKQRIVVRTYKGSQNAANRAYKRDSMRMAAKGYFPVAQSWAQGTYGFFSFLVALLLCLIAIGALVFIYMLIVKPEGTLTVTYEFRNKAAMELLGSK